LVLQVKIGVDSQEHIIVAGMYFVKTLTIPFFTDLARLVVIIDHKIIFGQFRLIGVSRLLSHLEGPSQKWKKKN